MATHSEAPVIIWTNIHLPDGNSFNMTFRGDDPVIREEFNAEINRIAQDHDIIAYNVSYNNPFAVTAYREQAASGQPSPVEQRKLTPGGGKDWGHVRFSPKAGELCHGDKYSVTVSQYLYDGRIIYFHRPDAQHALFQTYLESERDFEYWTKVFGEWRPEEGKLQDDYRGLGGELVLEILCSGPEVKTSKGNPKQYLWGKYRPGETPPNQQPEAVEEEPEETIPF